MNPFSRWETNLIIYAGEVQSNKNFGSAPNNKRSEWRETLFVSRTSEGRYWRCYGEFLLFSDISALIPHQSPHSVCLFPPSPPPLLSPPFSSSPAAFCLPLSLRMQPYVLMHQNWLHQGITLFFLPLFISFDYFFEVASVWLAPDSAPAVPPSLYFHTRLAGDTMTLAHTRTHLIFFPPPFFFWSQNCSFPLCVSVRVCFQPLLALLPEHGRLSV